MANKKLNQLVTKPSIASGDLFPIADATTGQLYKTTISDLGTAIGSGVSSVNGLVGAVVLDTDDIQELASPVNKWFTDLRARAAISVSSPLAYNSGTGLITIAQATGSANGYLSSADWTTFNAKQAALSGTGFVKISGTTISYDNSTYLTTSAAATNYVPYTGATANVNLGLNYSLTAALIIKSGGTSTQFLKADGSIDTNTYLTTGSAASTYLPLSGGTISGDLTISSTNPRIYLTDTDNNPDYFISNTDGTFTVYDVTNSAARFTIGTTGNATFTNAITGGGSITGQSLYSNGIISAGSSVSATRLILTGGTSPTGLYFGHTDKVVLANYTVGGGIDFETNGGNITMQLSSAGALSVTDGISGTTGLFTSTLRANSEITTYNGSNFGYWGVDSGNSYVYFGTSSTGYALSFKTGGTQRLGIASTGAATFSSSVTANSTSGVSGTFTSSTFFGSIDLENTGGTATGKWNVQAVSGAQIGGSAGSSFGIYSYGASAYRMFINSSGNVGIGTTSPVSKLHIEGTGTGAWVTINRTDTGSNIVDFTQSGTRLGYLGYIGNDLNINNATASNLVLRTSDAERMRITSGGNVGIGTTSPYALLSVYGGSAGDRILIDSNSGSGSNGAIAWGAGGVPNISARIKGTDDGGYGTHLIFETRGNGASGTTTTERMRITSGGNVLIGATSDATGSRLYVSGRAYVLMSSGQQSDIIGDMTSGGTSILNVSNANTTTSSDSATALNINKGSSTTSSSARFMQFYANNFATPMGGIVGNGANNVQFATLSDIRQKQNINKLDNSLSKIMGLNPVSFNWKSNNEFVPAGFIAQEVEEVFPEYVVQNMEEINGVTYKGLTGGMTGGIVPVLVKAIQELKAELDTLKNK